MRKMKPVGFPIGNSGALMFSRRQRKVFYSSVKGRKGKIECERKADEQLDRLYHIILEGFIGVFLMSPFTVSFVRKVLR